MKKSNDSDPEFWKGLEKGYRGARVMWSTPRGKITLIYIFGSMVWCLFIAPASCMKLQEVLPWRGVGFFVGFVMYALWFTLLFLWGYLLRRRRNIRIFGKPKLNFKESMWIMKEEMKQTWKEIKKEANKRKN